jgi:hypothetical protein
MAGQRRIVFTDPHGCVDYGSDTDIQWKPRQIPNDRMSTEDSAFFIAPFTCNARGIGAGCIPIVMSCPGMGNVMNAAGGSVPLSSRYKAK